MLIFRVLRPSLPFLAIAFTGAFLFAADTIAGSGGGGASTTGGFDLTSVVDAAIKSLGPLGILGWYLYYDKAISQPRKDNDQRQERQKLAEMHEARVDKIVQISRDQAAAFSVSMKEVANAFSATSTRMADVHEKMIENCYRRSVGDCPQPPR